MSRLGLSPGQEMPARQKCAHERLSLGRIAPIGLLATTMLVPHGCGPNAPNGESDAAVSSTAEWPVSFAIGHDATPAEIAALDIDFGPDGAGAPPGRGSVAEGKEVYDAKCAACHGPTGQEGPNDRLVGREPRDGFPFGETRGIRKTIGNYWPYATTIFDYVIRAMPMTSPGSLTADEVYAVAAYILFLNEIIPEDAVMNAQTLPAVVMPARDRFVPDDRVGGPEVR